MCSWVAARLTHESVAVFPSRAIAPQAATLQPPCSPPRSQTLSQTTLEYDPRQPGALSEVTIQWQYSRTMVAGDQLTLQLPQFSRDGGTSGVALSGSHSAQFNDAAAWDDSAKTLTLTVKQGATVQCTSTCTVKVRCSRSWFHACRKGVFHFIRSLFAVFAPSHLQTLDPSSHACWTGSRIRLLSHALPHLQVPKSASGLRLPTADMPALPNANGPLLKVKVSGSSIGLIKSLTSPPTVSGDLSGTRLDFDPKLCAPGEATEITLQLMFDKPVVAGMEREDGSVLAPTTNSVFHPCKRTHCACTP